MKPSTRAAVEKARRLVDEVESGGVTLPAIQASPAAAFKFARALLDIADAPVLVPDDEGMRLIVADAMHEPCIDCARHYRLHQRRAGAPREGGQMTDLEVMAAALRPFAHDQLTDLARDQMARAAWACALDRLYAEVEPGSAVAYFLTMKRKELGL